ncbi:hypothetical protein ENTB43_277 [Enterobacter phage Entb_43]|nr:hypothetical protein ENTB43_277 [Enterobacter phage Entb_43]
MERGKLRGLDKSSLDFYTESHHIIPSCIGGSDDDSNKVLLTAAEHYVAHQLLLKIHKNSNNKRAYHSLALAVRNMTIDATHTIRNNKMYEWIRTEYAKSQSIAYSGSGNPMFGKKHSKETKQMWSNKRKGSGNSMYGKKRPEVSKLMSELKRGPHWKDYDKIKQLWINSNYPGYVSFRKIAVKAGFPDVRYQRMIDKFKGEI